MDWNHEFSFCPELACLYSAEFAEGSDGSRFALGGCSTANNLATIKRLFEHIQPRHTLEIGLCLGGSGLLFTALHQGSGAAPEHQHTAIDPFQISKWKSAGLMAIERAGLSDYLDFRENYSSIELPRLLQEYRTFNIIYIDGSHLFEDVFIDAFFSARLLASGGVMIFDDSADPHVHKVLQFVRGNCGAGLEEMDLGPYRADGGTALRYRIARMFGKVQMTAFRRVGRIERAWNAPLHSF